MGHWQSLMTPERQLRAQRAHVFRLEHHGIQPQANPQGEKREQ